MSVLLYQPLQHMSTMADVWKLGIQYKGESSKTHNALEVVTQKQLQSAINRLEKELKRSGVDKVEAIRQTTIARNFLTTSLGLHHSQSVHIVPRHPETYDAVLNTSNPRAAAKYLSQQVKTRRGLGGSVLNNLTIPLPSDVVQATSCMMCNEMHDLTQRMRMDKPACGRCAARLAQVLTGSNASLLKPKEETVVKGGTEFNMDIRPGNDFDTFVNSKWQASNPIPDDHSRWGSFDVLHENVLDTLKEVLDAAAKLPFHGNEAEKVGALWKIAMDSARVNKEKFQPLEPLMKKIADIPEDTARFSTLLGDFEADGLSLLFGAGPGPHPHDSKNMICHMEAAGLGLPNKDFYFEKQHADTRERYVAHISRVLQLYGYTKHEADDVADRVMKLETQIAEHSMDIVEQRDPEKTVNLTDYDGLKAMTNVDGVNFDWDTWCKAAKYTTDKHMKVLNIGDRHALQFVMKLLAGPSPDYKTLKDHARVRLLLKYGGALHDEMVNEMFEFQKHLSGAKTMQPLWKRRINGISGIMGQAIGKMYCAKVFPSDAKEQAMSLVNDVMTAIRSSIHNLTWMSPETKKSALQKVDTMGVKIGYPDKFRSYSELDVDPSDSYAAALLKGTKFAALVSREKMGKPRDDTEWHMTPQTVNAYYSPTANEIVFPAAILQPPFFDPNADDATNFGGVGAVIGHELTHAFDDQGRKYDSDGNLRDWWTEKDTEAFGARAAKIVEQYDNTVIAGMHINGKLTQGENIADLGGLKIAYMALQNRIARQAVEPEKVDGLTPQQRFFVQFAKVWRGNNREESLKTSMASDPHSPPHARINNTLSNTPEFHEAWHTDPSDALYRKKDDFVRIW
mmetsp:Transcript_35697/g.63794  ORF Transcript_35697/g.63794 Transcript_35697/m.63794 type:complete len:849 (-) Transcript_35697:240-2786(-)